MVLVFHINRRLFQRRHFVPAIAVFLITLYKIFKIPAPVLYDDCASGAPIDAVYTWVNGSDPLFLEKLDSYIRRYPDTLMDASLQRFGDRDELRFSLRSLEKNAPWINHVYIVTNGQIPHWLDLENPKLTVITHRQIFPDKYDLPTFSSPAIEAHLHRIPGISKRFIYLNDDVFLQTPIYRDDFYTCSRGFLIYLAWLVPMCAAECSWLYVADGHCDIMCNNPSCQMDGGDCDETQQPLVGDVIVKFDDYEELEYNSYHNNNVKLADTNYQKILSSLRNSSNFLGLPPDQSDNNYNNVSVLIQAHNQRVIVRDKIIRRRWRKRRHLINVDSLRDGASKRHVDAYAASLQRTNRLLNRHYGFSVRKVPAHAPIMIDLEVMERMQRKFIKELATTSRNRFRSTDDVQFAFAYYYFLIHEKIQFNIGEIFDQFDTDQSGFWSDTEIRTLVTRLYDLPLTDEAMDQFRNFLLNCSSDLVVTREAVRNCAVLSEVLLLKLGTIHKYKFDIIKDADKKFVSFKMLNSNATQVMEQLDQLRKNPKKFVCLNDNSDPSRAADNELIKGLMLDFYMSLFPTASKFELPENYRNRFSYMEDFEISASQEFIKLIFLYFLLCVIIIFVFFDFIKRKLTEFLGLLFYNLVVTD